jgi:hypothetical protein
MSRWTAVGGLALLLWACSAQPEVVDVLGDVTVEPVDAFAEEAFAEVSFVPADGKEVGDLAAELSDNETTDAPDVPVFQCSPGEGCFLDQCDENIDCQSGWCVQHLGAGVCTQLCQEECPSGWSCRQVAGTDPDLVFVCVSEYANLCRPCAANADCTSTGGAADACIDYGPDGSFCGGPCDDKSACPWGFSCQEVQSVEGSQLTQCLSETGSCPCTASSIARGLGTPCEVSNEFGTCPGTRTCMEEGLTECSASTPEFEVCNGSDDDCDGEIDEPDLVEGAYILLCEDDNPCTEDSCVGEGGCVNDVLSGTSCDDQDPCSVADHCEQGTCLGEPVQCEDDNPCTDDACTPMGGCDHVANTVPCDDGDPCTLGDFCQDQTCSGTPVACDCQTDLDCEQYEDGDICNGTLICEISELPYKCIVAPGTPVVCPDPEGPDAYCMTAACDALTGECSLVPDNEGKLCDKTTACTWGETCQAGICTSGKEVNCNDGNPCTVDTCDPETGCLYSLDETACDDSNPCTAGTCDLELGCIYELLEIPCDDDNACTEGDTCLAGQCNPGDILDCNDDDLCTNDSCDAINGCVHLLNEVPCNDGDLCTYDDQCQIGQCKGTKTLVCSDGNPCTDDACNPQVGCEFVPNQELCDDGDSCTVGDHCLGGMCKPGSFAQCDDANSCTSDSCSPGEGCVHGFVDGSCDDDDLCTVNDACQDGQCVSGESLDCDDGNVCTEDSCDDALGCQHSDNAVACDDGSICTSVDICVQGSCVGGESLDCSDPNPCVDAYCDPEFGCQAATNDSPCDDADVCTVADVCAGGKCAGVTCGQLGQLCGQAGCVAPACSSLSFDGDDYMEVSQHTWSGELTGLTIEAWINTKGIAQSGLARIVNRHLACGAGASGSSFSLHFEGSGLLRLWVCTTAAPYLVNLGADVGATLLDNSWHHVAGTWESNGFSRVFVDGKKVAEEASFGGTVGKGALPFFLAGVPPYGQHYAGRLSSVRLSPIARYANDFVPAALAADASTLNFWPLGEGQGAIVHDAGATGQHGSVVGAAWVQDGPWESCCVPDCDGKVCGDDGCGGSCGECPPPVLVEAIDPAEAFPAINVNAAIMGSGFLAGAAVHFDAEQIPVLSVADTEIAVLVPAGLEPGLYDVKVTNLNGQFDVLEAAYTVSLDPETEGFKWLNSKQLWYKEVYVPWTEWSGEYAALDYAHRATQGDIGVLASAGLFQNGTNGWTTTSCYDQDWGNGGRTWIWWQGSILWANNCYPYPGAPQKGHLIWDWIAQ